MKLACIPRSRASSLTAGLSVVTVSAETSAGSLTKVGPHHHLFAGALFAVLDVQLDAGTVTVVRIYRTRL